MVRNTGIKKGSKRGMTMIMVIDQFSGDAFLCVV